MRFGAGVGGPGVFVEPSFIADADGVTVVASAVCSCLPQRAPDVLESFACDIVMVADVLESASQVIGAALAERVVLVDACCRAVDYDFVYCSHRWS